MRLQYRNQDGLWKHMAKTSPVRLMSLAEYKQRKALCSSLIDGVNRGCYSPRQIHGFLSVPKGESVARFIPVLPYEDTAVYFCCTQHVDKALATSAVTQTYGGWRLGGVRRDMEEAEALRLFGGEGCPSMPQSCYNRSAWMRNWQEYWKLLAAKYEGADDEAWFAMFDIANFYDSVDLGRLETGIRAAGGNEPFAIDVLFHFLRCWNKALRLYVPNTKGLPMDLVGDCSRLLANFFLTPFDRSFRDFVRASDGDFMRFADDMVVYASSEDKCRRFVYEASARLHDLGLNINVAKVRYCSKLDFERFWGFVIMDRFESGQLLGGLAALQEVVQDNRFGRRSTALKRAITLIDQEPRLKEWRIWVRDAVLDAALPLQLSREQLLALLRLYDDPMTGLNLITPTFLDQPFTQPLAILLQVLRSLASSPSAEVRDHCLSAIGRIEQRNDPVLAVALKYLWN
jgi:hypothetical protein